MCVYRRAYSLLRCALFIVFAKHRAVQLRMLCLCVYVQIMYARLCVCMWQRVVGQLLAAFLPFVAAEFSTQLALFMYILCMYTCINRTT